MSVLFFLSKQEICIYVLERGVFYRFPFLSEKGGRKKEIQIQCLNLFSPDFEKGFSHILIVVCALKIVVVCVTPSVPHSHSVNAGWGLK